MAVREYVGARYIPRFCGTLDPTQQYDALDVVDNGAGTSYIARKTVPPGTPLTNSEYWFVYGASSGAILDLQTRMDTAEDDIDDLEGDVSALEAKTNVLNSGIIVLGDSYGVDASVGGKSWVSYVEDVYPDIHKNVIGGTGFASDAYITDNNLSMLQAVEATITDPNEITTILILGGANDGNLLGMGTITEATLRTRIDEFCDYAKVHFPYATVKVAFVGGYRNYQRIAYYDACAAIYRSQISVHKNAAYFSNGEPIMKNNAFINTTDLVHPVAESSKILGDFALSILEGGIFTFEHSQAVTYTREAGIAAISYVTELKSVYKDFGCEITMNGSYSNNTFIQITLDADTSWPSGKITTVAQLEGVPVGGSTPSYSIVTAATGATGQPTVPNVPLELFIQNGLLAIKYIGADTLTVKQILLPSNTLRLLTGLN